MDSTPTTLHQLEAATNLPAPSWDNSAAHGFAHLCAALLTQCAALCRRYLLYRGNKVAYLRSLGVRIGADCDILTTVSNFGTEPWLIELGNRVTITAGVVLLTHDGANRVFRQLLPGSSRWGNRFGTIRIGDNCFIGVNTIILPGVSIGANSIVGVGSVVNRDVPPGTVVAGIPAKPICTLDEYVARYRRKMVPIHATNRAELRDELTRTLWGEPR